jgi:hypothetical protein
VAVTISNLGLVFSSKTGVNLGMKSWTIHLFHWAWCQEATSGIYFTKKQREETLQGGLEFDNVHCERRYLQIHVLT